MLIDNYRLVESAFHLNKTPKNDMHISQEYKSHVMRENTEQVVVIQSVLFTITESKDLIAELLFRYFIPIQDARNIEDRDIEAFVFEKMQYVYITQANSFLLPAHLPALYAENISNPIRSDDLK